MKTIMLSLALLAVAGMPAHAASKPAATVTIKGDAFSPATIIVRAGQTVAFVNNDDDAHTVTATDGRFDSKGLDTNGRWQYTFSKAGHYTYFCALHPFMKGVVIVTGPRK